MMTDENPAAIDCQSRASAKDQMQADNQSSPSLTSSSGLRPGCETKLPPEIWMHILTFLHKYELEIVSRVNSWFQEATLPMLWKSIEDLDYAAKQQSFLDQIKQDPREGNAVQELSMLWEWDPEHDNDQLIIEIAKRCPNVTSLHLVHGDRDHEFGPGEEVYHVNIGSNYVDMIATLFQNFPLLKEVCLQHNYIPTIPVGIRKEFAERCLATLKTLQKLSFSSHYMTEIVNLFLPHNQGHLRRLVLPPRRGERSHLFDLTVPQPSLTWLEAGRLDLGEIQNLLSIAPNLTTLVIDGVSGQDETMENTEQGGSASWIIRSLKALRHLTVLCIGRGYLVPKAALRVLASEHCPSLSKLAIARMTLYWVDGDLSAEQVHHYDSLLAAVVTRHSATLEAFHIGDYYTRIGTETIRACTKSSKLKMLGGSLIRNPPPQIAHILQQLAENCPRLRAVSSGIVAYASNDSKLRAMQIESGIRWESSFLEL